MGIDDNKKQIVVQILEKFGLRMGKNRDDHNTMKLTSYIYSIYSQIEEIEEQKKLRQQSIDAMKGHVRKFSKTILALGRAGSLTPATSNGSSGSSSPSFKRTATSQDIMESVLLFGKYFIDKDEDNKKNKRLLDDSELAEIYAKGDIDECNDDILTKIYEM